MVNYLKKSRIRKLLLSIGYPVPALKDCTYKFYRGSEWFEFSSGREDESYYHVYVSGYMSIDLCVRDSYENRVTTLERRFYQEFELVDLLKAVA